MSLGRVLIVDDEAPIRQMVRVILTKAGYDVLEAENGEQAISTARKHPLQISTIICDIAMPKVNGKETIAFLRWQFPSVPIIVLTGYPIVDEALSLLNRGVVDYLSKPITNSKLLEAVSKAIQQKRSPADQ